MNPHWPHSAGRQGAHSTAPAVCGHHPHRLALEAACGWRGGNGRDAPGQVRPPSSLDETFLEKVVLKTNGIAGQLLG